MSNAILNKLQPNTLLKGAVFPELTKLIVVIPVGNSVKLVCEGMSTGKVYQPILSIEQLELIEMIPADNKPFDGDAVKFRLGIEALRLGLAYEYDPYFSLSIARVDPLLLDLDPVDLHAVTTLHVANEPIAAVDEQLAVVGGDVGEAEHDIAALATANQKLFFQERDGIAAPLGD